MWTGTSMRNSIDLLCTRCLLDCLCVCLSVVLSVRPSVSHNYCSTSRDFEVKHAVDRLKVKHRISLTNNQVWVWLSDEPCFEMLMQLTLLFHILIIDVTYRYDFGFYLSIFSFLEFLLHVRAVLRNKVVWNWIVERTDTMLTRLQGRFGAVGEALGWSQLYLWGRTYSVTYGYSMSDIENSFYFRIIDSVLDIIDAL